MLKVTRPSTMFFILLVALVACNNSEESRVPSESSSETAALSSDSPEAETPADDEVEQAWEDGYRPVFSWVDNRHLLHLYDTGLFIDAGHPAGLKYVNGRWQGSHWQGGLADDEGTFAWVDGVRGIVRFPMTEVSGDYELVTRMKASSAGQGVDFFLNGEKVGSTRSNLSDQWEEQRFSLPSALLSNGENKVRFHFARSEVVTGVDRRTAGAFQYLRVQPQGVDPSEEHARGAFETDLENRVLKTPAYGGIVAYVTVPTGARLRFSVFAEAATEPTPVSLTLRGDGISPAVLWESTITAEPVAPEIRLNDWEGQIVRLELMGGATTGPGLLHWVDPSIVVPEGDVRTVEPSDHPTNIFIWLIDALRPDHFSVYNPSTRVQTPNLAQFADRCVSFRRATIQGNSSLPASASIHTATYPPVHQLFSGDRRVPRDLALVGDPFNDAGWDTALYSSNGYVSESRGFARGYDTYHNLIHEPGRADSEYLVPQLREWFQDHIERNTFLFANTIDPHVPYDPPEEILRRYHPEPYTGSIRPRGTGELLDGLGDRGLSDADLRYLVALYDGEITYNDIYFGEMVDYLETQNRLDDTLVVFTADHGEGFFEHGRGGHGSGVWEEMIYVPLMLCHPRSLGPARWIDTEVELVDLFPTLADLMDLPIPESVQGGSLMPLMVDNTATYNRPGFSYHGEDIRGLRIGRWKYISHGGDVDDLFDLDAGGEHEDRHELAPIAYRHMRDVMSFHLRFDREWRKSPWGFANNHSPIFAAHLDQGAW